MCELEPVLTAYDIPASGVLDERDSVRTVPEGTDESAGAHVFVHPNGKFVYVSNRSQHSVAVFAWGTDGKLTLVEHEDTRGVHPRHFAIDSLGEFLIVANKGSAGGQDGNLAVYRIAEDGSLAPLGDVIGGLKEPTTVAIVNFADS
jgi:6-phosphogluconolactonase